MTGAVPAGPGRPISIPLALFLLPGVAAVLNGNLALLRITTHAFSPLIQLSLVAIAAPLAVFLAVRGRDPAPGAPLRSPGSRPIRALAIAACALSAFVFLSIVLYARHGGIDAWMHWNMKARFIWLGGEGWADIFAAGLPRTHPDYPILLPLNLASFYALLGDDPCIVGISFAFAFAASTALLLHAAVAERGGDGALALCFLLLPPALSVYSAKQYADIEVAYFFLAATVCLTEGMARRRAGLFFLAGIAAAGAASTKNEGIPFAAGTILAVAADAAIRRAGAPRRLGAFFAGLAASVGPLIWFKAAIAPALIAVERTRIADVSLPADWLARIGQVLWTLVKHLARPTRWALLPFALLAVAALSKRPASGAAGAALPERLLVGLPLLAACAGYLAAYIVSREDPAWLIPASASRLFLQLWPALIFLALANPGRYGASQGP